MKDWIRPLVGALFLSALGAAFQLWREVIELRIEVRQLQRVQEYYHGRALDEGKR